MKILDEFLSLNLDFSLLMTSRYSSALAIAPDLLKISFLSSSGFLMRGSIIISKNEVQLSPTVVFIYGACGRMTLVFGEIKLNKLKTGRILSFVMVKP